MPPEEPAVHDPIAERTAAQAQASAQQTQAYEPSADESLQQDEYPDEPGELPRRPRRRLLTPIPLALLGVLLIVCGFLAGVLVEKGQGSSGAAAGAPASLASRFAAQRTGAPGTRAGAAPGSGAGGGGGSSGSSGSAPVAGQIAFISGKTIYVTTSEGNTVKVTTSPGTTVTKTVTATVQGIHPGETVTVIGAAGASGAISAESIRIGANAGAGLGALFGGPGSQAGANPGSGAGKASSNEPALFGKGG
jgi:hypothetical protein